MRITRSYSGKDDVHSVSLDFSYNGYNCITTNTNHTLQLYDCQEGKRKKIIPSLKYGCNHAIFSNDLDKVVHSSTKIDGIYFNMIFRYVEKLFF
ncbi:WD repeat-containing protein 82 [Smittium culicis]|uniref:WD repeat-containing protein 82 n=1 Tax=Smittium culicis TaxID=133412 RepID=A0A1R1XA65_9FUNG|nr:WD repeat-containing protein 82 [Smittium culicis]OMJ25042.1 WD repeat-containing protein 82 [Smittium culicis]